MFAPVAGVPAAPPTSGLAVAAARPNPDSPEWAGWERGFGWVSERCALPTQHSPWCGEPAEFDGARPLAAYTRPVEVRWRDECSTLNGPQDDERVHRMVEAQTPFAMARELWSGAGTQADPYTLPSGDSDVTNRWLASPEADVIGTSAASPLVGFGRLEAAALEHSGGQHVHLHVPVTALALIRHAYEYAWRDNHLHLVTAKGNEVIADAGYLGTGPHGEAAGDTVWAYATAPVVALASAVDVIDDDGQRVDRATNTRTTWASRLVGVAFDPCVHLATELNLEN